MSIVTRRQALATAAASFLSRRGSAQRTPPARPNIVLILADDLAAWMLGCYGNQEIRTPNIDRLAQMGMRFTNSFVATPICSASRATLFTGRLPRQHGIHDFLTANPIDDPPQGQKAPPPSFAQEVMLTDVLSKGGYRCGYVGKWHMGNDTDPGHGISYSYTMAGGSRGYTDPVMYLNGKEVQEKGYLTELKTRHALEFLDQQSPGNPFFLTVAYLNPHTPYAGHPQRYYDMYAGAGFETIGWQPAAPNALREKELMKDTVGNLRRCAASVSALDDQIPALLAKLDERKLRGDTLVIFTGDNGYLLGRHGLWSKGLASDPINMYEESVQVPMIWHWLGKVPPQATRSDFISFYDFLPTICDLAGVPAPAGRNLTGRSYLPIAMGRPLPRNQAWPTTVFGHFRNTEMARDKRFKLVLRDQGKSPGELFDLHEDPREMHNLYDDPGFVTVRQRLAKELEAWRKKTA